MLHLRRCCLPSGNINREYRTIMAVGDICSTDDCEDQEKEETTGVPYLGSLLKTFSQQSSRKILTETRAVVEMGTHFTLQQKEDGTGLPYLVSLLKTCAQQKNLHMGLKVHAEIARCGPLESSVFIGSALVSMYAKCGAIAAAKEVFDMLPVRNIVSWTSLIAGYAQLGYGEEALFHFEAMQHNGLSPDAVTFACILKACGGIGAVEKGQEIHAQIDRDNSLKNHIVVGTAVVDMYCKCGLLGKAQEVFDQLPFRNVVSWTALITGYAQHENGKEALRCFEKMQDDGLSPNESTFPCLLKACGSISDTVKGRALHAQILKEGLFEEDIVIANALVDMYAKCGELSKAQEVFDDLPLQDVASWGALIGGYTLHSHDEEALHCFEQMRLGGGPSPNIVTFVCVTKSCGSLGAPYKGQEMHGEIVMKGCIENDMVIGNALVDMYVNVGMIKEAQHVFETLQVLDMVTWNALLAGYAQLGKDADVFLFFDRMVSEQQPDLFSFTILLNACSHKGLVEMGQMCFEFMSSGYGIFPDLEHHTCLVDLFGRAGQFDMVTAIVREMPLFDNLSVWHSVLGASQKWGNAKLGRWAFEHALQLDEKDTSAYVCMSNICATGGSLDS